MFAKTRYQSVCRWSFHPGKGGFVPGMTRPSFEGITPEGFVELVAREIVPRVPENTRLGVAVHYDREIDEESAKPFVKALKDNGLVLSMLTPGGHYHYGYGGLGSPDAVERAGAIEFGKRTIDLLAGPLGDSQDPDCPAVFDVWNGSFGYEIPGVHVLDMLQSADDGIAELYEYGSSKIPGFKMGVEPKPNEGHPAMLYQTTGEVLALRSRLERRGFDVTNFGLINEFGHTEMSGLDLVQEYAAAALENAIIHVHANSQGADGVRLGGSGKFDIDFGVAPSATTFGVAHILLEKGYSGWIEHDMQPRPYDNEEQNINRVIRSVVNWESICRTIEDGRLSRDLITELASNKETMELEDVVRSAVGYAHELSVELFRGQSRAGE